MQSFSVLHSTCAIITHIPCIVVKFSETWPGEIIKFRLSHLDGYVHVPRSMYIQWYVLERVGKDIT